MKFNLWTLLIIFIIGYFVFQIREDVLRFRELRDEKLKLTSRIDELKTENTALKKRLTRLTQGYYIESLARERLNLIKKGETAFKVCP
jgi:cell division protein FtsB